VKEVGKEDGEGGDDGEKGEGDNDDLEKNINEQFRLKGKKKPIEEKKPAKSTGKAKEKAEQPLVKETTPSTSSPSSSPSTPVSAPSTAADAPSTGVDDSQNEAKSIKKVLLALPHSVVLSSSQYTFFLEISGCRVRREEGHGGRG